MKPTRITFRYAVLMLFLLMAARPCFPQAAIYSAGDPLASTTVVRGREVCGTLKTNMAAIDGNSYSNYNASEFAANTYEIRGSVPNPMGRDTSAATAGRWGVTIVNPTNSPLNVTAVEIIDVNNGGLFNAVNPVEPLTGWSRTNTRVSWSGSIDVPARSTYGFMVQIQPRNQSRTGLPITLQATTAAGTLTSTNWVTSERNNNNCPYVSLPFSVSGVDVFTGNESNGGSMETGASELFTVKIVDAEQGNGLAIPTGSTLTITIPPGWSGVDAAQTQTGFGIPTIIVPADPNCQATTIEVATTSPILVSSRPFQFTAKAPEKQGGTGLYTITARIRNDTAVPPINTITEFVQVVSPPPSGGTRTGITQIGAYISVPKPMGTNVFTTWGVAVADPTDNPLTVTSLQIAMLAGDQFFKAITPVRPKTGWTLVSKSFVQWTGSVTISPHDAANFVVQIQGNRVSAANKPVLVSVNSSWSKQTTTTEGTNNPPAVSLYYLASGEPSIYTYGSPSGQSKTFQVVIKETQGVNINAGAELRIVIPAGWSSVDAAVNQGGFTPRLILQPTPTDDGYIRTTTASSFKSTSRTFTFSAVAPPNLLASLFLFPTTLTSTQVNTTCEMLTQVVDSSGGLRVEHVSPPMSQTDINQIDIHLVAGATPDTPFSDYIYNFSTSSWELLNNSTFMASPPSTLLNSITRNFEQYFNEPILSPTKRMKIALTSTTLDNHRLDEDYVAFVVSEYYTTPQDLAPATTFRGATGVPMEGLKFETQEGFVDLYTIKVAVLGSDPTADVTLVRLFEDRNCNGAIDPGDTELVSGLPLDADNTVTFGQPGVPLLTFSTSNPVCAIIALDIDSNAGAFDTVSIKIAGGFDLTSSVGTLYPFPAVGGYPIESSESLIPGGPPSLVIDKIVTPSQMTYPVGTTVEYDISVRNLGESPSTNVQVWDELDPAWQPYTGLITPLDGGTLRLPPVSPTPRIVWPTFPTIAGNSTQTVTVRFQAVIPITVANGAEIGNIATADSADQPQGVTSNLASITVAAPVMYMSKTLPPTPPDYAEGETIQWTIDIQNGGGSDATNVIVTDTIDDTKLDETTITSNPPGTFDPGSNTLTWTIPSVAAGGQQQLQLSGRILHAAVGAPLCNTATATWDQGTTAIVSDPPGGTCTSTAILPSRCDPGTIPPAQRLKVVKSGTDLVFTWTGPTAPQQHLNQVTSPGDIGNAWRAPLGQGAEVCTGPTPDCTATGAVTTPPTRIFYQAVGACGPSGNDEGAL